MPKNNQKGSMNILLILILATIPLAILGYLYRTPTTEPHPNEKQKIYQENIATEDELMNTIVIEKIQPPKGWLEYTNTEYGYTLYYPEDWKAVGVVGNKDPTAPEITPENQHIDIYPPNYEYPDAHLTLQAFSSFIPHTSSVESNSIIMGNVEAIQNKLENSNQIYDVKHPTREATTFEILIRDESSTKEWEVQNDIIRSMQFN